MPLSQKLIPYWEELESSKKWFALAAERLGAYEVARQPKGDEWSFVELIEHLLIPESAVCHGIQHLGVCGTTPSLSTQLKRIAVRFVMRNGIKVPVPSERAIPRGSKISVELFEEWDALRTKLLLILSQISDEDLGRIAFRHPVSGPLDVVGSIEFACDHLMYHIKRAKRVFPALR